VRLGFPSERFLSFGTEPCFAGALLTLVVPEQRQQDDDGNGNAQQPKKHASTKAHVDLRLPHCEIHRFNALMRMTVPWLKTFSDIGTSPRHFAFSVARILGKVGCAISGAWSADTEGPFGRRGPIRLLQSTQKRLHGPVKVLLGPQSGQCDRVRRIAGHRENRAA